MVDANYKFVVIDVGSFGREGDSGIFLKSILGQQILNGSLNFPKESTLPGTDKVLPYVILGDQAFRLHKHILRPYSQKAAKADAQKVIFNYRLSRARRVTENDFGLLSQVFRVYYQPINLSPKTCDDLIIVTCCLHNMLREAYLENTGRAYYQFDPENFLVTHFFHFYSLFHNQLTFFYYILNFLTFLTIFQYNVTMFRSRKNYNPLRFILREVHGEYQ